MRIVEDWSVLDGEIMNLQEKVAKGHAVTKEDLGIYLFAYFIGLFSILLRLPLGSKASNEAVEAHNAV